MVSGLRQIAGRGSGMETQFHFGFGTLGLEKERGQRAEEQTDSAVSLETDAALNSQPSALTRAIKRLPDNLPLRAWSLSRRRIRFAGRILT